VLEFPVGCLAMKILIADDHVLFREGVRQVCSQLADDIIVVEAADYRQTLVALEAHGDFALALLDLYMPGEDGFTALDTISRSYRTLPIVVLSASDDPADMRRALDKGAMGYIPKSASLPVILSALRLVLSGGIYVPPQLLHREARASSPAAGRKLTPRQIDVLGRVIEGKPNKVIAAELRLSEATVKAHITAVFTALNVTNRTMAARAAERVGLRECFAHEAD
jgi:two-component system, NarL family, nitrate/nitrite response regulator NarL